MIDAYIDFTTPIWLVHYYYIIGTLNLVLNCYTLFLIIFKTEKIDSFKYYLFAFQCACFSVDFHLTFLMQPQPLHPLAAGFCTGIASSFLSGHTLMCIVNTLLVLQFLAIFLCFLRKLVVFRSMKRLETPIFLQIILVATLVVLGSSTIIFFFAGGLSQAEMWTLIEEEYQHYEASFKTLPSFAIYRMDLSWMGALISTFFAFIYCGFFFTYSTYSMFTTLREMSKTASRNNLQKQKSALISLVVQLVTLTIAMIPVGFLVFLLLIEFKYAQWGTRLELMLYCFHSTANALVVVITIPSFRRFTFFWMNRKHSPMVVSIQGG